MTTEPNTEPTATPTPYRVPSDGLPTLYGQLLGLRNVDAIASNYKHREPLVSVTVAAPGEVYQSTMLAGSYFYTPATRRFFGTRIHRAYAIGHPDMLSDVPAIYVVAESNQAGFADARRVHRVAVHFIARGEVAGMPAKACRTNNSASHGFEDRGSQYPFGLPAEWGMWDTARPAVNAARQVANSLARFAAAAIDGELNGADVVGWAGA